MYAGDEFYDDDITSGPQDDTCEEYGHRWENANGRQRRRGERGWCRDCDETIGADE